MDITATLQVELERWLFVAPEERREQLRGIGMSEKLIQRILDGKLTAWRTLSRFFKPITEQTGISLDALMLVQGKRELWGEQDHCPELSTREQLVDEVHRIWKSTGRRLPKQIKVKTFNHWWHRKSLPGVNFLKVLLTYVVGEVEVAIESEAEASLQPEAKADPMITLAMSNLHLMTLAAQQLSLVMSQMPEEVSLVMQRMLVQVFLKLGPETVSSGTSSTGVGEEIGGVQFCLTAESITAFPSEQISPELTADTRELIEELRRRMNSVAGLDEAERAAFFEQLHAEINELWLSVRTASSPTPLAAMEVQDLQRQHFRGKDGRNGDGSKKTKKTRTREVNRD